MEKDTNQNSMCINDKVYDVDRDFIQAARLFCDFIEAYNGDSDKLFLLRMQLNLQNIYQLGQQIGIKIANNEDEILDIFDNKKFEEIINSLVDKLLDNRYYWIVFNPIDIENTEAVCGDLLDDVGDIYKDIKKALLIFDIDSDSAKENALWLLKFQFDNHWGDHCINAIYAIHYFLKNNK